MLRISLLILPSLSKNVLEKSKFFKAKSTFFSTSTQSSYLYIQISKTNIKNIVKTKENFLSLSTKKIEEVYKKFTRFSTIRRRKSPNLI